METSLGPFCTEVPKTKHALNGRGPFCACKHIDPQLLDLDPASPRDCLASASWGLAMYPLLVHTYEAAQAANHVRRARARRETASGHTYAHAHLPAPGANRRFSQFSVRLADKSWLKVPLTDLLLGKNIVR